MGPFLTDEGESSPDLREREGCRTAPARSYASHYDTDTHWCVDGRGGQEEDKLLLDNNGPTIQPSQANVLDV